MAGPGAVRIGEHDPRYPALVRGFNQRWIGRPRFVEVCREPSEVVRSVTRALESGLRITVRSGGHCYEDFVSDNDGGVILDLSAMNAVYRDARTARRHRALLKRSWDPPPNRTADRSRCLPALAHPHGIDFGDHDRFARAM